MMSMGPCGPDNGSTTLFRSLKTKSLVTLARVVSAVLTRVRSILQGDLESRRTHAVLDGQRVGERCALCVMCVCRMECV